MKNILVMAIALSGLLPGQAVFAKDAKKSCIAVSTVAQVLEPYRFRPAIYYFEAIDNIPELRRCGLALTPNDLRNVTDFRELVGVVLWGINKAGYCQPCRQ